MPDEGAEAYGATLGNAFGIKPRLTQTAWYRPCNRSEEARGPTRARACPA